MKISNEASNKAILIELGERLKAKRLSLNISQTELAQKSGLSVGTVKNIERGKNVAASALLSSLRSLDFLSDIDLAIPSPVISPINATAKKQPRQRAFHKRKAAQPIWGDDK